MNKILWKCQNSKSRKLSPFFITNRLKTFFHIFPGWKMTKFFPRFSRLRTNPDHFLPAATTYESCYSVERGLIELNETNACLWNKQTWIEMRKNCRCMIRTWQEQFIPGWKQIYLCNTNKSNHNTVFPAIKTILLRSRIISNPKSPSKQDHVTPPQWGRKRVQ